MKHKLCNTCKRKKHCANCKAVHRQGCERHTDNIATNEAYKNMCASDKQHYFFNKQAKKKKQGGKA